MDYNWRLDVSPSNLAMKQAKDFVESMLSVEIPCQCGNVHQVGATDAGSTINCSCGKRIEVPLLSQLRRSAGLQPVPLNTVETIEKMKLNKELPSNKICPVTNYPADTEIVLWIDCESSWVESDEDSKSYLNLFVFFLVVRIVRLMVAAKKSSQSHIEPREKGREIAVYAPLAVSQTAVEQIKNMKSQRELKKLLMTTEIYAQLLAEYPDAHVNPNRW